MDPNRRSHKLRDVEVRSCIVGRRVRIGRLYPVVADPGHMGCIHYVQLLALLPRSCTLPTWHPTRPTASTGTNPRKERINTLLVYGTHIAHAVSLAQLQ